MQIDTEIREHSKTIKITFGNWGLTKEDLEEINEVAKKFFKKSKDYSTEYEQQENPRAYTQ